MDFAAILAFIGPALKVLDVLPLGIVWLLSKWLLLPAYALWLFFLAVMTLERARGTGGLYGVAYVLALPIIAIGFALDLFVTVTLGSILFLDIPREATLTARLKRYAKTPGTWRYRLALLLAGHLLDRFDPAGWHVLEVKTATPKP